MGQPVVHFEVIGKDAEMLRGYAATARLFGHLVTSAPSKHHEIEVRNARARRAHR